MLDLPPSQRVHTEYARNLIRMKSRQLLHRPEFCRDDRHDIEQDLWLHLLSRSAHFDPSRGSVNGFIACVVRTGVANLVRQHKRRLQSPDSGAQSLEGDTASDGRRAVPLRVTITPADLARRTGGTSQAAAQQRPDSKAFSRAYRSLTSRQRQICSRLLEGSLNGTARELGLSRRSLSAGMVAIRKRFEEAGFEKKFAKGGQSVQERA